MCLLAKFETPAGAADAIMAHMRIGLVALLLLFLTGCADWDWKRSVRSALESACNSIGNCAVSCDSNPTEGWCQ